MSVFLIILNAVFARFLLTKTHLLTIIILHAITNNVKNFCSFCCRKGYIFKTFKTNTNKDYHKTK